MNNAASVPSSGLSLNIVLRALLAVAAAIVLGALVWQGVTSSGNPDPTTPNISHAAVVMNTGLLVFREGLEAILVMAALMASLKGSTKMHKQPIAVGAGAAVLATVATWFIAIAILDAVSAPALDIQAATGLLAIIVLLVIMNWFFHNVYWTGWISMHNKRKKELVSKDTAPQTAMKGLALLGFSAMYREGFEIVLFLQNLRLRAGSATVLQGVAIGLFFTAIIGVLTFVAHKHLPYKKMLILTGVLLAGVLLVMVGESVQEMQLAHWIGETPLPLPIPDWMGLWFAIFPNVQGLAAQAIAALLVFGSYFMAQYLKVWRPTKQARNAEPKQTALV
jgi:high-affinity iron transporter